MNKTLIINEEYLKEHRYNYTVAENGAITVEGGFDCSNNNLTELIIPENLTVAGSFYCSSNKLTELVIPKNLTVAGSFYCFDNNLTKLVIPENLTVAGGFYCFDNNLTKLVIPENLTVAGGFDCSNNNLTELIIPENFTIGGGFDCSNNNLTELIIPENFTVAGSFYCSSNKLTELPKVKTYPKNIVLSWQNGKYRKIDGIFCEVLKKCKNVLRVKTKGKEAYVFEKDGVTAHGRTVKQAYYDWLFKTSDRDVEEYREINPNDVKPLDYWVIAYRQITGACSFGTNEFLENNKEKYKEKMTLNEVIIATKGQYGCETFKKFFTEASDE